MSTSKTPILFVLIARISQADLTQKITNISSKLTLSTICQRIDIKMSFLTTPLLLKNNIRIQSYRPFLAAYFSSAECDFCAASVLVQVGLFCSLVADISLVVMGIITPYYDQIIFISYPSRNAQDMETQNIII